MEWEWPIWKISLGKGIPINEIKYNWCLKDIWKALDFMEMENDYDIAHQAFLEKK